MGETFELPKRRSLSRLSEVGARNATLSNIVQRIRQKNLILDYRLIRDPIVAYGAIDVLSRGEISWLEVSSISN